MNIEVTLDRFEGDKAILKTKDNQNINWPKNQLPENSQAGQVFNFRILTNQEAEKDKKELAKNILNEILES